jgi:hypothetical protein
MVKRLVTRNAEGNENPLDPELEKLALQQLERREQEDKMYAAIGRLIAAWAILDEKLDTWLNQFSSIMEMNAVANAKSEELVETLNRIRAEPTNATNKFFDRIKSLRRFILKGNVKARSEPVDILLDTLRRISILRNGLAHHRSDLLPPEKDEELRVAVRLELPTGLSKAKKQFYSEIGMKRKTKDVFNRLVHVSTIENAAQEVHTILGDLDWIVYRAREEAVDTPYANQMRERLRKLRRSPSDESH